MCMYRVVVEVPSKEGAEHLKKQIEDMFPLVRGAVQVTVEPPVTTLDKLIEEDKNARKGVKDSGGSVVNYASPDVEAELHGIHSAEGVSHVTTKLYYDLLVGERKQNVPFAIHEFANGLKALKKELSNLDSPKDLNESKLHLLQRAVRDMLFGIDTEEVTLINHDLLDAANFISVFSDTSLAFDELKAELIKSAHKLFSFFDIEEV